MAAIMAGYIRHNKLQEEASHESANTYGDDHSIELQDMKSTGRYQNIN